MKKWLYIGPLFLCVLGGFAAGHLLNHPRQDQSHRILYYVDPMHPSYRSTKPGIAPDCGMELVPVYADTAANSIAPGDKPATGTNIDPSVRRLYGIRLAKAEKQGEHQSLRLFGRVGAEDTRIFRVDFGADGYVKETRDDAVGSHVKKDQHLAIVYSPDFLALAGGYLRCERAHSRGFQHGQGQQRDVRGAELRQRPGARRQAAQPGHERYPDQRDDGSPSGFPRTCMWFRPPTGSS